MAQYRVRNVDVDSRGVTTHVGEAGVWKATKDEVINFIRSGAHSFYVQEASPAVAVQVVPGWPAYLRTTSDSTSRNNLDNLPTF